MITTRKRLLSLLLAITMVITLLPHTTFAADSSKGQKQGTEVTAETKDPKDTKEEQETPVTPVETPVDVDPEKETDPVAEPQEETSIHDQIHQLADSYYLDPTSDTYRQKIHLELVSVTFENTPPRAGDSFQIKVKYTFDAPDEWYGDGYSNPLGLYTSYGLADPDHSIPTSLKVHLPAGMTLTGAGKDIVAIEPDNYDIGSEHYYTIDFPDTQAASNSFSDITFTVFIGNNGTADSLSTYSFPDDLITLYTNFMVVDLQDPTHPVDVAWYEQSDSVTIDPITTVSPDQWSVQKSNIKQEGELTGNLDATFTWDVGVGLLALGKDDDILVNENQYRRSGRNLVEQIFLKDEFLLSLTKAGADLSSVTPTVFQIQKYGEGGVLGTAVSLLENSEVQIWGTGADGNLIMNELLCIDSNGDPQQSPDEITPTYTKYKVTMTFKVLPDHPDWIADFPELNGYVFSDANTATVTAYLAKLEDPQVEHSTATQPVTLPTNPPAKLTITKMIKLYTGGSAVDYDQNSHSPKSKDGYGEIKYVISAAENFSIYKKTGDNAYEVIFSGANSYELTTHTDYYLVPGIEYTVTEDLNDDQLARMTPEGSASETETPAAGEPWDLTFTNKETVGRVWIHKTDDSGRNLGNAYFGLFLPGSDTPVVTGYTDPGTGYLTFDNVPYGTYTLHEINAPSGYAPDFEDVTVTVSAATAIPTEPIEASNTLTGVSITLYKYVGGAEGSTPTDISTKATSSFPGTFVLQRRTANSEWEDVDGVATTVDDYGKIFAEVDAFATDGSVYYYRFVETIPEGYYDPATDSTTTSYGPSEDGITLTDANGIAQPKEVNMYNRKIFKIKADKNFYDIGTNGKPVVEARTTSVTLYKSVNGGTPSPVGTDTFGWTSTNPETHKYAEWSNLRGFENGQKVTYLLKESEVAGYEAVAGTLLSKWSVDNSYFVINTNSLPNDVTFKPLMLNYRQIVRVRIYKRNWEKPGSVILGSKVTVYDASGNIALDPTKTGDDAKLEDITIISGGTEFYLTPGQRYTFVETVIPPNTHWIAYQDQNPQNTLTYQNNHHQSSPGVIDLTGVTQPLSSTEKVYSVSVFDQYDPILKIKKVSSVNTNTKLSGAKFKAYIKNAEGKYEPYPSAENQYEISADDTNQTNKYFPAGTTYYFAETAVPANYLDPNENFEQYHAMDSNYVQGQTVSGETLTFYPLTPTNSSTYGAANVYPFTFKNIPNLGSLKVKKTVDGVPAAGFSITVSPGNITPKATDSTGYVTFTNLPVYDDNGQLIQYTIGEAMNEAQSGQYIQVSEDQTATLTLNTVTTVDINGEELVVKNETRIKVTTTKVFRRAWEFGFVGWDYLMEGAEIGLFVHDDVNNKWVLVDPADLTAPGNTNPQLTDGAGQVNFTGLQRGVDYILVELASGNDSMYPYQDDGFKTFPPAEEVENGIPDDHLDLYNVLTLSKNDTIFDPQNPQYEFETDRMVNSNHWVQFHITKWLDATMDTGPDGKPRTHYATAEEAVDPNEDELLDNAVFELYRIVMPDNETNVTFDVTGWEAPYNVDPYLWTRIGTYTSGTMYFNDERQSGEFMTDSDQDIDEHYVYLLVEKNAGPTGAIINPEWKYTFWHAEGTEYTVTISDGHVARDKTYTMDAINDDDILNARPWGEGGGVVYLASVRIAKWQDSYDLASGELTNDYQPLPGARFELTLPDGTVISEMTVGLETAMQGSNGAAIAQSGTYLLEIKNEGGVTKYYLTDYEASSTEDPDSVVSYEVDAEPFEFTQNIDGQDVTFSGYRILTYLQEVYAPEGYSYIQDPYPMYLCFVNIMKSNVGVSWVFNDAYFVLNGGTDTTETLAENQIGTSFLIHRAATKDWAVSFGDGQSPLRIVDYPTENTMVDLYKYGYVPNGDVLDEDGEQLFAETPSSIGRIELGSVDFYIKKYDETSEETDKWKYWDYTADNYGTKESAKFTTDHNGFFRFSKGLPEGIYKIWEDSLGPNADDYEMAYPESRPRIFVVTKATLHLHLFNPKNVSLEIAKQDMAGNTLEDVEFVLTPTPAVEGYEALTATYENGVYKFANIPTLPNGGKYVLSETKAGYSSAYLEMYLNSIQAGLGTLATTGLALGYEWGYPTGGEETDPKDVSVHDIIPMDDATMELTIKNPKLVNISLTKIKEGDPNTTIKSVGFNVYYKPFPAVSGDVTMSIPDAAFTTSVRGAQTQLVNAGWTIVGGTDNGGNAKRWNTGNNGVLSFTNQEPGVYVFLETDATTEYSIIKDIDNKNIFYVAVVTGGLPVNVNFTPTTATIKDYTNGGNKTITTYFEAADDVNASFTVENRPKIKIQATKIVDAHELTLSNSDDWGVFLNLWSNMEQASDPEQRPYALVKLTKTRKSNDVNNYPGPGPLDFKTSLTGSARWFALGDTYYLQEVVVTPEGHMMIQKVKLNGTELTANENGFYEITISGDQTMSIEVTNDWLYGRIIFTKYDADQPSTLLSGAAFEVRYLKDGEWVKVPDSTVVESPTLPGTYIADFPLVSPDDTEYRIFETDPPDDFLPDPNLYISATLSKENNLEETGLSMPNSKGNWITITKFGNVHDATGKQWTVEDNKVWFKLYRLDGENWVEVEEKVAENGGVAQFLTIPGEQYAIAESYFDLNYYNGIESVWLGDTELTPITVTVDGEEVELFVLGESTGALTVNAYNYPYIKPRIEKADIGNYQGEEENTNVEAYMTYAIYEVTEDDDLPLEPTRAEVEAFMASHTALITGNTERYDTSILPNGTFTYWESSDPAKRWNPDKTYLLVETEIGANGSGAYDTLRRDDPRVTWYDVIEPVEDPNPESNNFYRLENIYGNAKVDLEKDAVNGEAGDTENDIRDGAVESLLDGARKVVFTITPLVSGKNQMLQSFIITEQGLTFDPAVEGMTYSYTKIVVGSASHVIDPDLLGISSAKISATVTFLDSLEEGATPLGTFEIGDISSDVTVTNIPAGTKYFTISYYSDEVHAKANPQNGFDDEYWLGESFEVQPTTVYITVDTQTDGTFGNPVDPVAHIQNDAAAELSYPKWDNKGETRTPAGNSDSDDAVVDVNPYQIPAVAIEKGVSPAAITFGQNEQVTVTYSIKVTNKDFSPVDFVNPIVLDILPTAVQYAGNASVVTSDNSSISMHIETAQGEPSVISSGGVEISEAENAVIFYLTCNLKPGASATITFDATVYLAATMFVGLYLQNDAYVSSAQTSHYTTDPNNPYGYGFTDDSGVFGDLLGDEAGQRPGDASRREAGMEGHLGDLDTLHYGWISDSATQVVNDLSNITLKKAVKGDRDGGFHDEGLGYATRTNSNGDTVGSVEWRLTLMNGWTERQYINDIAFGDVIPKPGDGRSTIWENIMAGVEVVENNLVEVPESKYTVYYYSGAIRDAKTAMLAALNDRSLLTAANGWTTTLPAEEDVAGRSAITAFVLVLDPSVELLNNTSMMVIYKTDVFDCPDDKTFFDNYAFQNATNKFYASFPYDVDDMITLESNPVTVALMDKPVEIQGDVWIDEDWDSVQGASNRRDYSEYAIIDLLKQSISFSITDQRKNGEGTMYNDTGDQVPLEEIKAESVKHFRFADLGAAMAKTPGVLYVHVDPDDPDSDWILSPILLKGDDPYYYVLRADVNFDEELSKIFSRSELGPDYYKSDSVDDFKTVDPDTGEVTWENWESYSGFLDDNFFAPGTRAATGYTSAPFYVPYGLIPDQSKDIGFRMSRELEIIKVAEDNIDQPIEGATFRIYGPYEEGEGTEIDPDKLIEEQTTGADGKILFTGLNWWKEYVIEEVSAGLGYDKDGMKAWAPASSGTEISTNADGSFRLHLPSTEKVDATEHAMVSNPRYVEIPLQVEKILNSYSTKDYTFKYELRLESITPAEGFHPQEDGTTMEDLEPNKTLIAMDPIEMIEITVSGNQTTGQGKNTGAFTAVEVNGPGTYLFSIKEIAPNPIPDGWTYDPQLEKTATVVVEWDEATKQLVVASIDYSDPITEGDETYEKFTNSYEATGEWIPNVLKELTGRPLIAGEFTFELRDEEGNLLATGTNDADGNVTFDPEKIEYTLADVGTHTYTITEVEGSADGVTYSTQVVTATVTVTDEGNGDGKLKVEATYSPENKKFINTFDAEGEFEPIAWKVLNGRDFNEDEVFTLELRDEEGNLVATGTVSGGSNGTPAKFTFDPAKILYTEEDLGPDFSPKTFTYTLTELKGTSGGVTYSEDEDGNAIVYTVHVTISLHQNEDGTYSNILDVVDDMPEDGYTFINTYESNPAKLTPEAEKSLEGEETQEPMTFDFVLTLKSQKGKDDDGNEIDLTDVAYLTDDPTTFIAVGDEWTKSVTIPRGGTTGSVTFDEFTFTEVGTYVFEIKETPGTNTRIEYSPAVWTWTVTVVDDLHGSLVATGEYALVGGSAAQNEPPVFVNIYTPNPTEHPLEVEKILTGEPLYDAENTIFKFWVEFQNSTNGNSGYEMCDPTYVEIPGIDVENGGGSAIAHFGNIKFTKAGVYIFHIYEDSTTQKPKVVYDDTEWTATVTVVDILGDLAVTNVLYKNLKTSGTNNEHAIFTNDYNPEDTSYTPKVRKIVTGEPRPDDYKETFHFTLELISALYKGKDVSDGATLGETTAEVVDEGEASFGQITFTKKGTYVFLITELPGSNEHYEYDEHTWTLTVVVKDDAEGNLYVCGNDGENPISESNPLDYVRNDDDTNDAAEFANKYTPDPVAYKPQVKKNMSEDSEPTVEEKSFTFEITPAEAYEGVTMPADNTVTVTVPAGSTVSPIGIFEQIEFTKAGTYTFNVSEVEPGTGLPGITYTDADVTITLVITDIQGQLTITDVSTTGTVDKDGIIITALFENIYIPAPTEYQPKVTKEIEIDYGPTVADKEFTFEISLVSEVNANGDTITGGAIIANDGATVTLTVPAGEVTNTALFKAIQFVKAGTFTFKIVETAENEEGITYDAAEWTLIVVVRDTDGELAVESYSYIKDGQIVEHSEAVFDEETGKLVTPVEDVTIGAEFTNPYKPEPTNYQPKVTKVIAIDYGPIVREKIFNFELTLLSQVDAAGDPIEDGAIIPAGGDKATVTIPAGGTTDIALFGNIRFDKAGTYTFKIVETAENEEGITYDAAEWTLIVVIRDTDGELAVESYSYEKDGQVVEHSEAVFDPDTGKVTTPVADTVIGAEFTNPYKPVPTNYQPKVTKVIAIDYGPIVREKIFNFELTLLSQVDAAGNAIEDGAIIPEGGDHATVTIPAGGTTDIALFGSIRFDKAGTYTFKIVETAENEEGITYDAAEWTLIVVIRDTDNELEVESYQYIKDGQVVAESTATFDPDTLKLVTPVEDVVIGAEFTNPYVPEPTYYQPKVTKVITIDYGPIVREKIFNFELTLLNQVDAAGQAMEDGVIIPSGGNITTVTIPAGGTTDTALFGNLKFQKAGTFTFKIVETAENEEGITYDAAEWTLIIVIRDTDNELEVESYQYIKDGEVVAESTATFDPDTLKLVTPVEEVVIGAEFINPYKPEPTYYQPKVTKVIAIDYGPIVREKIFNFELTLLTQVDAAGNAIEDGAIIPEGGDKTTLTIPAGGTTEIALFGNIRFDKAGTYTFKIVETAENEEGITYDAAEWTLIVVIRDTDNELEVESYQYIKDGQVVAESTATFDPDTLKLVTPVEEVVIGAEFTNPYKPEPTYYQPKVTKVIAIDYGPIVREKIFNFELTLLEQVDAAGDPIEDGAIIPEGGDKTTLTIPAGGTTDIALFGNIRFDKAGTYTFKIVETAEDEEGITYDAAEWTLIVVIRDTDNELEVESYQYIKDGEVVAESTATFDEETLKLVEPVEDTVIGAEFINPYKPEPTDYQPKVTKVIELGYGPTVEEKIFNFELTLLTQVDAAGDPIEDGAVIPEGGDRTTLTIPAGEVTEIALFGDIEFVKAGTYTFRIVETAENEEGITYDAAEWTLTVVIRDTDHELVVESYAYEKDGEVVDHSEATFDEETGKVVDEVADTVIGAEFINPYKPEPTEYPAKVLKTVIGEPTVADKFFHFTMEASDENPAGASLTSADEALEVEIKVPAGTTGAGVEAFFEAVTFDRAGTFTFIITELLEDEEGVTYDGTVWTLTVEVTDTDGVLEITDVLYEAEDKDPSLLAFFENPYAPSPINAIPHVTKTLSGQTPSEDMTFEFVLTAVDLVAGGSFVNGEEVTAGSSWTKTIVGAGTVEFDAIQYVKAGTYTYTLTETDTHANGWTYSAVVWTFTVTVTDLDGCLDCETAYTAGEQTGTTAEFINYYEPNPVEWNPEVQKVLSEDSDLTRADATFLFTMKFVEADVEDGCSLTAEDVLAAETLLPAGEFESEAAAFDKITFTKAGLYTFEIVETDDGALGFTYDTAPKTLTVKVIDVSGDLVVNSVTVDGGEADIDGTKVTVIVENEYEEYLTEVSGIKTWQGDDTDIRPVSITIRLYADGTEIDHVVVTKEDDWKFTFTGLLKYNTDGSEIVYTITEDAVLGYITDYDGYNVTNRRIPDSGDTSILPWAIAMGGSVAALGGVLLASKKKRKEDEEE